MLNSPSDDFYCADSANIHEVRPFYAITLLVLAGVFAWSLSTQAVIRDSIHLVAFTALMLIHGAFHWIGPNLTMRRRWLLPYFLIQGALAFTIVLLAPSQNVLIAVYLCLIGQAVGVLEDLRPAAMAVVALLALSVVNFAILWGVDQIGEFLFALVPLTFVVVLVIAMFVRQARARQRSQVLLRQLQAAHAQVEELTRANERQRIAREWHDTLAQGLTGVILQLEAIDAALTRGKTERAHGIVNQAMTRARATLVEARRTIDELRDEDWTPTDFANAVRTEAARFSAASGIPCHLDLALSEPIPESASEHGYRAVAEGLSNIARHAHADQVWLRVAQGNGNLEIVIRDNGCGFDPTQASGRAGHYGLLGLRERARLAHGTLDMTSVPGAGTTLTLRLPIQTHEAR